MILASAAQALAASRSNVRCFGRSGEKTARDRHPAPRAALLCARGIEIGSSFGRRHGRIWGIRAKGYNPRVDTVLATQDHRFSRGAGVDAAQATYTYTYTLALASGLAWTQRRAALASVFPNRCLPRLT